MLGRGSELSGCRITVQQATEDLPRKHFIRFSQLYTALVQSDMLGSRVQGFEPFGHAGFFGRSSELFFRNLETAAWTAAKEIVAVFSFISDSAAGCIQVVRDALFARPN